MILSPQARQLLKVPKQAELPTALDELYSSWFAGRSYVTRFGGGWSFDAMSGYDGDIQHSQDAQAEGYCICLEHRTAQFWFGLDAAFRVYVQCDEWILIASSFVALVEEDAMLEASNVRGGRRRGFGTFSSFEEFLVRHRDYLSSFQEVSHDPEFARIFRGDKSVVIASRFYSDDYAICGIEYF